MDAIKELKKSVVEDFLNYLDRASIGYSDNYSMILNKICFIQTASSYKNVNFIYEFLKSN